MTRPTSIDPRLSKLFGAACRVCALHDHELGEPSRAEAIEILREVVNSMSPLRAEQGQAVGRWARFVKWWKRVNPPSGFDGTDYYR